MTKQTSSWNEIMQYSFLAVFANDGRIDAAEMAFLEKLALRDGTVDPQERAYRVSVVDIDVDIAAASVHTLRAVDYLHLVRTGTGWRIVNALWRGTADEARWRW